MTDLNRPFVRLQARRVCEGIGFGLRKRPDNLVLTAEDEVELAKWRAAAESDGFFQMMSETKRTAEFPQHLLGRELVDYFELPEGSTDDGPEGVDQVNP